ncbi:cytochrome c oxidase assembly protein [Nonomuraea phyllanthi]|uniref:Cytochrome c oxidase assembly protein n=1 Tax=Nonomuraea phyllanthi TaxID=2219224 RepID=A0A5C4WST6_9ACTN|nr:cytochrome c oxidase assembly protein [Nonomuraea phyllanthi]KAB8196374.1 cytochrome c oxidase assembly protein [Nonomuraea phyllanthi]QFY05313.1 cytochrome c oxidase assembly protein [Nonomuraea phyllanthi]
MTAHHEGGLLPAALPVLAAAGYVLAATLTRSRGWSAWRAASFVAGCALVVLALTGPVAAQAAHDFRGHMLQHLLIGMLAPVALVLGAPVTLLLRTLPTAHARRLTALLRSRAFRALSAPSTALVLSAGGLVALYCTPLYELTMAGELPHHLVHLHFLLSGYLFAWVIAGPDPAPHRSPVPRRLVVLGVAIAVHSGLSQLMYAGVWVDVPVPGDERRGAAEIMYYGGDIAELLLALALVTTWRPSRTALAAGGKAVAGGGARGVA